MIEKHASEALVRERYGWAEMSPDGPVVAGETGTWKITYHAGRYGIDDGGVIKFAWRDVLKTLEVEGEEGPKAATDGGGRGGR